MTAENRVSRRGFLPFVKMSGAGNDFIVVDNRERRYRLTRKTIARLCHRKFGIGADGLLVVEVPRRAGHDFRMRYYNADGGEAEMCGNGARCIARFYHQLLHPNPQTIGRYAFETQAGTITAKVEGDFVSLSMVEPRNISLGQPLRVLGKKFVVNNVNTGVPHAVVFVDDLSVTDVERIGKAIRWHKAYKPAGTNADFVELLGRRSIRVRTFERGVEAETLACGTGVTASAIAAHLVYGIKPPVTVLTQSGRRLEVDFAAHQGRVTKVVLSGPAEFVFEGRIALEV